MRRRGKTFLSLFLSAVIVTGQPVLAADFSAGEETFISETTEQEGDVSEASAIFEDTVDSDSEMRYEKYEATVSSEILDLGQTGVNGSGWGWERLEIKNTGTEAWHIKSISELNDFTLEPFDYPFQGRFPMEVGNKVKPGEGTTVYLRPKKEEQVATDIFKVSITGGIELSYIISQNCPHIAPPYPEGATIKDVKVQGSTIKAVAYDCANSEGFDAVLTKKSWVDKPENYVKVAKNQDAKTITFTNVKNGTYYLGIHAYNRDYYDGKVSGKRFGAWSYPVKVVVKNGIPTERVKIKTVKTGKGAVAVTVGVPKGFARADMELRSTGGTTVYKRNNRTTYTRITGVKPGTYTLRVRPWAKTNGRKAYGDWVSWGRRIRVK